MEINNTELTVIKVTDEQMGYENCIFHGEDFAHNELYLFHKKSKIIYKSIKRPEIPKGSIGVPAAQRLSLNVSGLGDQKTFFERLRYDQLSKNKITEIDMNIIIINNTEAPADCLWIHSQDFSEKMLSRFKDHFFCKKQYLLIKYQGFTCRIIVNNMKPITGFLTDKTKFIFRGNDLSVKIVNSGKLNRNLFKRDFNFEDLGVGGLNQQLIEILADIISMK